MAFLIDRDYQDSIQDDILDTILDNDDSIRTNAELKVQSQMEGYLSVRYDVPNIFNKTGDARNGSIVMYMVDMVVYRVMSRIAPGQIPQHINDKYGDAIKWLEMVSAGKLLPDLPTLPESDTTKNILVYGSETKRTLRY